MLRNIFSYTEFMLIILFARWNLPKSFLEELETVDQIYFSGQIWPDSGQNVIAGFLL